MLLNLSRLEWPPAKNNFTLLRLLAASLVLLGHGYRMYDDSFDPFTKILRGETIQETALHAFFVISGYLIMQSRMQHSLTEYARNRVLRIYPALLVNVVILTFVCRNGGFLINASGFFMEGVRQVNSPLWTIQVELWLYLVVGLFGKRAVFLTPLILLFRHSDYQAHALNAGYFGLGAAMMAFQLKPRLWMALPLAAYPFMSCYMAGLAALVLWLAVSTPAIPFKWPDISYGVYLYAWPIQKWLLGFKPNFIAYELGAWLLAMVAGYLSMRFIEKPALKLKQLKQAPS